MDTAYTMVQFEGDDEVAADCGLCGHRAQLPLSAMGFAHDLLVGAKPPVKMVDVQCPYCDEEDLMMYENQHARLILCRSCAKVIQNIGN